MSRSHAFYVSKRRHLGDQEATLRIELSITWALCFVVRARLVVCIIHRWIMTNTGDVVLLSRSRFAAHGSPIFERSTAFRDGSYLDQAILALLKMFEVQDDKKWEIIFLQATFLSKSSFSISGKFIFFLTMSALLSGFIEKNNRDRTKLNHL